uniref:Uncharacterized protein n=1 Tax=Eutreptiella gymnastica TaxID=73025 RepID=A0A7S1IBK2_9EUGL
MFQPMDSGWVGVEPAMVIMVEHFALTYVKQLNHRNPAVRRYTQRGLWDAYVRYHSDMPCVQVPFGKKCPSHDTDHDKMVSLLMRSGFTITFPQYLTAKVPSFPMASCQHAWQAVQVHHVMETGVRSLTHAVQHVRSHKSGTYLDAVLNKVDEKAKQAASLSLSLWGGWRGSNPPRCVFFTKDCRCRTSHAP